MKIVGSVVGTRLVDGASPIAYGYDETLSAYCDNGPIFSLSSIAGARGFRRLAARCTRVPPAAAPSTIPISSSVAPTCEPPEEPKSEIWETPPVTDEQLHNNFRVIPPADRARVIFRYADNKDLLISGLVEGGDEIAQHRRRDRRPHRQRPRRPFLHQSDLSRRNPRHLFAGPQHHPEFRQPERRPQAGGEVGPPANVSRLIGAKILFWRIGLF